MSARDLMTGGVATANVTPVSVATPPDLHWPPKSSVQVGTPAYQIGLSYICMLLHLLQQNGDLVMYTKDYHSIMLHGRIFIDNTLIFKENDAKELPFRSDFFLELNS